MFRHDNEFHIKPYKSLMQMKVQSKRRELKQHENKAKHNWPWYVFIEDKCVVYRYLC